MRRIYLGTEAFEAAQQVINGPPRLGAMKYPARGLLGRPAGVLPPSYTYTTYMQKFLKLSSDFSG